MNVPCKDCGDRSITCHAVCEKYRAYNAWREEVRHANHLQVISRTLRGVNKAIRRKQYLAKQSGRGR